MFLASLLSGLLLLGCVDEPPTPAEVVDELGLAPPESTAQSDALSTPPARSGNQVQLLINGEAAFQERMRLLEEAERSIYIQVLIWKADTTGRALADALIARKRAKPELDIRIIVDTYANIQDVHAQLMYFDLQNAGIDVEGFEAFYLHWLNEVNLEDWLAGNKRYHEKYWIVDGKEAVLGGMNIADEYARCSTDPLLIWRDQDILLAGPVVKDVEQGFLDNFEQFKRIKQAKGKLLDPDQYWRLWREKTPGAVALVEKSRSMVHAVSARLPWHAGKNRCGGERVASTVHSDISVRYIRSRPREGERHIHQLYLDEIGRAQQSIFIENAYFVPTADLTRALEEAAKRGVKVQVVSNSEQTNDIPMITIAGRARYLSLIDAGVEVYEWHGERFGEGTVHSKFAIFDDRLAVIGSYNLDPRSIGLNSENVVVVDEPAVATELMRYCLDHDLPMAERIDREQAIAWADPGTLPVPPDTHLPWDDPRFDPRRFEYFLLRQIESNL